MPQRSLVPLLVLVAAVAAACGGDGNGPGNATVTPDEARVLLQDVIISTGDVPDDYAQDANRFQTNEEAATARPDTEVARQQFRDWGQVLSYNVQYAAPPNIELITNGKTARIMHTATVFHAPEGAMQAMEFVRSLSEETLQDVINSGSGQGTVISDAKVTKDIEFVPKGDESTAFRVAGVATLENGLVVNFVADALAMRVDHVTTTIVTVALGQPPARGELEDYADLFVERVRAAS
jgi:hypothetical protein